MWSGSLEAIQLIVSIVYSFHCVSSVYQQQDNLSAPKCANQSFEQANMIILLNRYTSQSFEQDNIDYESLYLSIIILLHKLDMIIWIHFWIIFLVNHLNRMWSYFSALLSPLSILFSLELCGQTQILCCFCKSLSFEIWCRTIS